MQHPYDSLTPDRVVDCIESTGLVSDLRLLALNSYENRVYQVGIEGGAPIIAKFYREGRWSDEQILEEQAKDQALEDAMDYLDEALGAKKIELEPYLEFIRELSKEQFFARATTMVTRKAQRERGRSQGVTF